MNEVNMAAFIEAKSDQLNADDLLDSPRTITVTGVSANPDSAEQPVSISYEGDNRKPFKPCKTMRRLIVAVWGADAKNYVGRSMTLYRDADVQFGGMQVGGIRISHMSHIEREQIVPLMVTRGRKKPFKVLPLRAPQTAAAKSDKAAQGAEALIARIKAGEDVTGDTQAMNQIAWLEKNRPDLAAQVKAAMPNDDPFAEQEGGASNEEAQTAPPSDWSARIDGCADLAQLGAVEAEWFGVRDGHEAPEQIDAAFDAMRNALKRKAA